MVSSTKIISDWTIVIAFAIGVALVLSLFLRPKLGVLLYVLFMPIMTPFMDQVVAIPGSTARIGIGGFFLAIILFAGLFVIAGSDKRFLREPAVWVLTTLLLILAMSVANAPDMIRSIKEVGRIAGIIIIAFVAAASFRDESDIRHFVAVLLLSMITPFAIGIYQKIAHAGYIGYTLNPDYYIPPDQRYNRIMGTFGNPVAYAMFINFPLLLCLTFGLDNNMHAVKRLFFLSIAAPLCLSLFFTYTRSCWFGMIAATLFIGVKRNRKLLFIVPALLLIILVYVPLKSIRLGEFSTGKLTFSGRIEGHIRMLPKIFEQPLLGHGITSFAEFPTQSDHLRLLLEAGFLGYVAFLGLLFALYKTAAKSYLFATTTLERNFILAFMAYFVCVFVVGFSETNAIFQYYVWVPAGIMLSTRFHSVRKGNDEEYLAKVFA